MAYSKVNTAETTLIHAVADHYFPGHRAFGAEIAAFKEACLAQGRAEGAEQEKADLLKGQIHCDMHGRNGCIVVPASALASEVKP